MLVELGMLLLSFSCGKVQFSVAAKQQSVHVPQALRCEGLGAQSGGRVWSDCNLLCPKGFAYPSTIGGQLAQKS